MKIQSSCWDTFVDCIKKQISAKSHKCKIVPFKGSVEKEAEH